MIKSVVKKWHSIVESKDLTVLELLIADDAIFYSPVVHTPQEGKAITFQYLSAALHVFGNESFRYVREICDGNNGMLEFEVEIDGVKVNGVDIIQCNDEEKIVEFKVMLRPLKGVNIVHQKMMAMLAASH